METASHLDSDEAQALQIAVLYRIDPEKAERDLKIYFEKKKSLAPVYKFLSFDFLKKQNLIDGNVIKSLAKINTRRYFVQRRVFFIDQDAGSYGMFYSTLVRFSAASKQCTSRLLRNMLRIIDPLKAIDMLSRLVLLPKLPFEHKKMIELFYVLSSHNQRMPLLFVKNAFLQRNDILSRHVLRRCNYGHAEFSALAEVDIDFCKRHIKNFCKNKALLGIFLRHIPASEFLAYKEYFDSEVLLSNLKKIRLLDAQELSLLLSDRRIFTGYWDVLSCQKPFLRFQQYELLNESLKVFEETRRLLKRLSLGNIEKMYTKIEDLICESPVSFFRAMIETICSHDMLLCVIEKIFVRIPTIFVDILYFCLLKIFISRNDFVNEGRYMKWYVNLCSLFKIIMPLVQLDVTFTILEKFFELRRYAHIPLLESIVHKHTENNAKKIPNTLIFHVTSAVNDVFLYENYPLELKMDLSERYRKLHEVLGGKTSCTVIDTSLENLKYLTSHEIAMVARCISKEDVNKIADEFKITYRASTSCTGSINTSMQHKEVSSHEFFTIRNFILLVNARHNSVQDIDWFVEYLRETKKLSRNDLRLLGECCLSNILVDMQRNKRYKVNAQSMDETFSNARQSDNEDLHKTEKHELQKSSQEEGEIR
eukprot:jgi/Antlo1/915/2431